MRTDAEFEKMVKVLISTMSPGALTHRTNIGTNALHLAGGIGHVRFMESALPLLENKLGREAARSFNLCGKRSKICGARARDGGK